VRRRAEFEDETWEVLAKPARRLEAGARVTFGDGRLSAETVAATEDGAGRVVRFHSDGDFGALLEEFGRMPLPPYIKREAEDLVAAEEDRERYQTVYAAAPGAIAAPTAGLHFTPQVFAELRARGVRRAEVTLHVGYGTFAPVRALESAVDESGRVRAGRGETGLTITPGYRFRAADAMLTNFHLPRSSLLVLVSAFAGRELTLDAYRHAVAERYRFYSYGDCMLIV